MKDLELSFKRKKSTKSFYNISLNSSNLNIDLVFVSPYPPPNQKHSYESGVASYTKNLSQAIRCNSNLKVCVIADKRKNLPDLYDDNGIIVYRVFERNLRYAFNIFGAIKVLNPKIIHFQHEYFLYGGPFSAVEFPLAILLSRMLSRYVLVTLHGVIPLKLLDDKNFRQENGITGFPILLKIALLIVTKLIASLAHIVILHEDFLKEFLVNDYHVPSSKIVVVPHGIEKMNQMNQDEAKKKLGFNNDETVILYFGYLTGYKGVDVLLEAYRKSCSFLANSVLIIAGGEHPRLKRYAWYRNWIMQLVQTANEIAKEYPRNARIIFTGFLREDQIPLYFSAADLVVLPYKARFAASGPESIALAFRKKVIISTPNWIPSADELAITIARELTELKESKENSKLFTNNRSWSNIAREYLKVYNSFLINSKSRIIA
jgi:glycosyltransferase involved in cell wall biosynthesis